MIINHNLMAMNTHRQLGATAGLQSKSMEKLSSGLRINRAGDDAAGLAISEKMRAQIRGLNQASRNSSDGISLIQTAEGALNEVHDILGRMRELANQSSNGTYTAEDRANLQDEVSQLKSEIDRIGNTTEFNTMTLLNGSLKSAGTANVGLDTTTGAAIAKFTAGKATSSGMTLVSATTGVSDAAFAEETISVDGVDIKIRWQDLTTEEKNKLQSIGDNATAKNEAVALLEAKINEAIDATGKNVDHVKVYYDSSDQLVIESGSEGIDSKIGSITGSGVIGHLFEDATIGSGVLTSDGTATYNGTTLGNEQVDLYVGDILMQLDLNALATNGEAMTSVANDLETAINAAITTYNGTTGKASGEDGYLENVTVKANEQGRLQIASESGPVRLEDRTATTAVKDLGLSEAQTEAAGNGGMVLQIGANRGQILQFGINDMRTAALSITSVRVDTQESASIAITSIDAAITKVSQERSKLGAAQNRLEHTIKNLNTTAENLQSSESRIRDVDMAAEMMTFTKNNILQQAAQSMLAQANQAPQGVLQLLR